MEKRKAPTHLTHKPIYAINNYHRADGIYKNDTDVYALSIGKAQWNTNEVIPSVKVWRKKNGRWSRQSEETTITRALDMAMLVIKTLDKHYNGKDFKTEKSVFGNLEIDDMQAEGSIVEQFEDFLMDNKDDINEHIKLLKDALDSYEF